MRTPEELRALWIEALRSGKYEQTQGLLRRTAWLDQSVHSFCCLGVACDLIKDDVKGGWNLNNYFVFNDDEGIAERLDTGLDGYLREKFGISHDLHELCIRLNDTYQFTFEMIARVVECMFEYEDRPEYLSTISDAWER